MKFPLLYSGSLGISPQTKRIGNDKVLVCWMFALILLWLWLVSVFEVPALRRPHDDYLFIILAKNLLSGEWLGPYNHYTLIKGPVYPLFIALSHLLAIPLLLAQQILYAFSCVVAIYALRPYVVHRALLMTCFALLLFNPFLYNFPLPGRVLREGFSLSLVLLVFASLLGLISRLHANTRTTLAWSALFGISFALLWYTREEGIWMLPAVLLTAVMVLMTARKGEGDTLGRRVLLIAVPAVIFVLVSVLLAYGNYRHYGKFIINELKAPEFVAAYGGLMNIEPEEFRRFRPVSNDVLHKAFAASPSLRDLEPIVRQREQRAQLPPSFFIWSFRSLVNAAGYTESLPTVLEYYQRVGAEIADACRSGALVCLDRKPSLQPPWHASYNALIMPTYFENFRRAVGFTNFKLDVHLVKNMRSDKNPEVQNDYRYVTLNRLVPSDSKTIQAYPEYYEKLRKEKVRLLADIGKSYGYFVPVLFLGALFGHGFLAVRDFRRRQCSTESVFSLVLLGGLVSLIAILTFVQITLWPVARPMYSAYPLVLLYICFLGCAVRRALCRDGSPEGR